MQLSNFQRIAFKWDWLHSIKYQLACDSLVGKGSRGSTLWASQCLLFAGHSPQLYEAILTEWVEAEERSRPDKEMGTDGAHEFILSLFYQWLGLIGSCRHDLQCSRPNEFILRWKPCSGNWYSKLNTHSFNLYQLSVVWQLWHMLKLQMALPIMPCGDNELHKPQGYVLTVICKLVRTNTLLYMTFENQSSQEFINSWSSFSC